MAEVFRGITFFDFNYALKEFNGSVTVSSSDETKWFAFDGSKKTRWLTTGEDTDGDSVSIERDFEANRSIQVLFIYNTNISNIAFEYYDGSWHSLTHSSNCTIIKSSDNKHIYVLIDSITTMSKIRITGSNTITANQEKYIYEIYAFKKIGTLEYPVDIEGSDEINQDKFKKEDSKATLINKGISWDFTLRFRSHINQNDIDLYNTLKSRETEFYIWVNAGLESQFKYKFEPYRFQDIYKVGRDRGGSPALTDNLYWTGLNDILRLIEVS